MTMRGYNIKTSIKVMLLVLSILLIGLAKSVSAASDDVVSVNYHPQIESRVTALDIYSEGIGMSGRPTAPVMIYVHGGAWQTGDKSRVHSKASHFVMEGFVFVSLNYRLVPDTDVDGQLRDIANALEWVNLNIGQYGGDRNNIHLMGHSAGAHLVSMTVISPQDNVADMLRHKQIKSVISNDTRAYDIPRIAAQSGGKLSRTFQPPFGNNPAEWTRLSPIYHISTGPTPPPFLILHSGAGGANIRHAFAADFAAALERAGINTQIFDGRQYSHSQINRNIGKNNDITQVIDQFLQPYR